MREPRVAVVGGAKRLREAVVGVSEVDCSMSFVPVARCARLAGAWRSSESEGSVD